MAKSRNGGEFARRFKLIAGAVRKNTVKIVKRAAIAADQAVVIGTPVDTGRLRANWLVGIGTAPAGEIPFAEGKDGSTKGEATNSALASGRETIGTYRLGRGAIFITNNVAYAAIIDAGSSAQAPQGMTARAVLAARKQLGSAKLLKGT